VDDLDFLLDGHLARAFASQGQLRALVLAWKTAEMQLLRDVHGDAPVLLLDDVSSELDPKRSRLLFERLARIECQSFVTTTHPRHVLVQENRQDFQVINGEITRC
jgi:DNA replication and repair protein RecF